MEREAEDEVLRTGIYPLIMAYRTKNGGIEQYLELQLTSSKVLVGSRKWRYEDRIHALSDQRTRALGL